MFPILKKVNDILQHNKAKRSSKKVFLYRFSIKITLKESKTVLSHQIFRILNKNLTLTSKVHPKNENSTIFSKIMKLSKRIIPKTWRKNPFLIIFYVKNFSEKMKFNIKKFRFKKLSNYHLNLIDDKSIVIKENTYNEDLKKKMRNIHNSVLMKTQNSIFLSTKKIYFSK